MSCTTSLQLLALQFVNQKADVMKSFYDEHDRLVWVKPGPKSNVVASLDKAFLQWLTALGGLEDASSVERNQASTKKLENS